MEIDRLAAIRESAAVARISGMGFKLLQAQAQKGLLPDAINPLMRSSSGSQMRLSLFSDFCTAYRTGPQTVQVCVANARLSLDVQSTRRAFSTIFPRSKAVNTGTVCQPERIFTVSRHADNCAFRPTYLYTSSRLYRLPPRRGAVTCAGSTDSRYARPAHRKYPLKATTPRETLCPFASQFFSAARSGYSISDPVAIVNDIRLAAAIFQNNITAASNRFTCSGVSSNSAPDLSRENQRCRPVLTAFTYQFPADRRLKLIAGTPC